MLLSDAKKSNNLQLIRFFAAICVILSHSFVISTGDEMLEPLGRYTLGGMSLGGFSVSIFFICGGYLIAKSAQRHSDFKTYFKARILRIFPPLAFVVVLCVLLLSFLSTYSIAEYFSSLKTYKYLLNAVLVPIHELPGVFSSNPYNPTVNGALWTLPVEFACYIACFIFLKLKLLKKKSFAFTLPLPIIAILIEKYIPGVLASAVRPCVLFFIGMAFFVYSDKIKLNGIVALVCGIAFVLTCIFKIPNVGLYLFLPYLLFYVSFGIKQVPTWLGSLGNYSYSIYLWGFPVQQTLVYLFAPMTPFVNFIFSAVIAVLLGIGTYFIAEKPFSVKKG